MKGFEVSSEGVAKGLVAASMRGEPEGSCAGAAEVALLAELSALAAEFPCSCINSAGMISKSTETSPP